MDDKKKVRLIGLQIRNLGLITAMDLQFPENGLMKFVGLNRQGKSTAIHALKMLCEGKKSVPANIVRHGEKKAEIKGKFNAFDAKLTIKNDGTTALKVEGIRGLTPQKFLDAIKTDLTFDPRLFSDKSPKEMDGYVMNMTDLDVTENDAEIKQLEKERYDCGVLVRASGEIPLVPKVEPVDVEALKKEKKDTEISNKTLSDYRQKQVKDELEKLFAFNLLQKSRESKIEEGVAVMKLMRSNKRKISEKIQELQNELALKNTAIDNQLIAIDFLTKPEPEKPVKTSIAEFEGAPMESIETQIEEANETNRKSDVYKLYLERKEVKEAKEKEYDNLTFDVNAAKDRKKDKLKTAKLPVKGLEIREDGLYLNGTFCANMSSSESMTLACDLISAKNPAFRGVTLDHGGDYDPESLEALGKWATEHDFLVLTTVPARIPEIKEEGVIYIEEGKVVE